MEKAIHFHSRHHLQSKPRSKNCDHRILLLIGILALTGPVTEAAAASGKDFLHQQVLDSLGQENTSLIQRTKESGESGRRRVESEIAHGLESLSSVPLVTENMEAKHKYRELKETLKTSETALLCTGFVWETDRLPSLPDGKEAGRLKDDSVSLLMGEEEGAKFLDRVGETRSGESGNTKGLTEDIILGGEESYKAVKNKVLEENVRKVEKWSRGESQDDLAEAKREKNSNEISSLLNTKEKVGQGQVLSNEDKKRYGLRTFVSEFLGNVTDEKSGRKGGKDRIAFPVTKANNKNNEESGGSGERIQEKKEMLPQPSLPDPSSLALIEIGYGLPEGEESPCNLTVSASANLTSNQGQENVFFTRQNASGRKNNQSYQDNGESDIQSQNDSRKIQSSPNYISESQEPGGTKENSRIPISSFFLSRKFNGKYNGNGERSGNRFERRSDLFKDSNQYIGQEGAEVLKHMEDLEISKTVEITIEEEIPPHEPYEDVRCKDEDVPILSEKVNTETDIFGLESSQTSGESSGRSILGPGPSTAVTAAGIGLALYVLARTYRYLIPLGNATFPFTDSNRQNQTSTTTTNNNNGTSTTTTTNNNNGTTTTTTTNNNGTGSTNTTTINTDGSTTTATDFGNGTIATTTDFGNGTIITTITTNPVNGTAGGNPTSPGNPPLPGETTTLAPGTGETPGPGPGDSSTPGNPTVPGNETTPGNPTVPGNGTSPGNGTTPGNPAVPGNGTSPGNGTTPGSPIVPGNGTSPGNGTTPGNPAVPGNGTSPGNGTPPTIPGNGTSPNNPAVPGNGASPGNGTTPNNPAVPGTSPGNPAVPGDGTQQETSTAAPESSSQPGGSDGSGTTTPENSSVPTSKTLSDKAKMEDNWDTGRTGTTFVDETVQRRSATPFHWTVPPSRTTEKNPTVHTNTTQSNISTNRAHNSPLQTSAEQAFESPERNSIEAPFNTESMATITSSATSEYDVHSNTWTSTEKIATPHKTNASNETSEGIESNENMGSSKSPQRYIQRNKRFGNGSNPLSNTTAVEDPHTQSVGVILNAMGARVNARLDTKISPGETSNVSNRPGGSTTISSVSASTVGGNRNITRNGQKTIQNIPVSPSAESERNPIFQITKRNQLIDFQSKIRRRLHSLLKFFTFAREQEKTIIYEMQTKNSQEKQ